MLSVYLKITWRNLLRSKFFSSVNIIGLGCGIAMSLLMIMHVRHELSYDTFFPDHELIYRVASVKWAKTSPMLAPALKGEMPAMDMIGRFFLEGPEVITHNEVQIPTQFNYLIDPSIITIFNFSFRYGNAANALANTNSIVLTMDVAEKLFNDVNPIGRVIRIDDDKEYTVTGVIDNIPSNSHLKIETLISISGNKVEQSDSRTWKAVDTYVRFKNLDDVNKAAANLRAFQYRFLVNRTKEEIDRDGDFYELHAVSSIHLNSHREKEMEQNSDMQFIYIFSFLSVFIIFIASINFINLFTAQSVKRMKEIGIKKVIGASRKQLFQQFLSETFLMTLIAAVFALVLTDLALPFYRQLTGLQLKTADLFSLSNLSLLAIIIGVVAMLSGFYPAFVISNYNISESLKNKYTPRASVNMLRKGLVIFQFMISGLVIILTLVISKQMNLLHNKDLGFSKDHVVTVKLYGALAKNINENRETLKNELMRNHNIKNVSVSTKVIGDRFGYENWVIYGEPTEDQINHRFIRADASFIQTLGLTIVEGRDFIQNDSIVSYIVNEEARKQFGSSEIVGKQLGFDADKPEGEIVGIVKNFNFASLHNDIEPLVIECRSVWPEHLLIRLNDAGDPSSSIAYIRETISAFTPGALVIVNFLDDKLELMYQTENNMFRIFQIFSVLSIIIATLGLSALSAHAVESRVKEIGIRKVLGATVSNILLMLSANYIRLLVIACLLSIPVAYYFANVWLTSFAYRTTLAWWIFVTPGMVLITVTLFIVTVQSLRSALADPVKSLRYE